jgi:hypothetical protein
MQKESTDRHIHSSSLAINVSVRCFIDSTLYDVNSIAFSKKLSQTFRILYFFYQNGRFFGGDQIKQWSTQ